MDYRVMIIRGPDGGDLTSNLELLDDYQYNQNFTAGEYALILYPQDRLFSRFLNAGTAANYSEIAAITEEVKEGFSSRAKSFTAYLSPGRVLKIEDGCCYSCGWLFDPEGELILEQRQIFLNREERKAGLKRGGELELAETEYGRIGFLLHTDCWYPEVGRFLALEGADLVLAVNCITGGDYWKQLSGVWSQVQQNQFYALEASRGGADLIHSLCEITPYRTGIAAPVGKRWEAPGFHPDRYLKQLAGMQRRESGLELVEGLIEPERRIEYREKYDLIKLLNTRLYQKSGLDNLLPGGMGGSDELGGD